MPRKFPHRCGFACAALVLSLSCGIGVFGQGKSIVAQQLYLLSGTPTEKDSQTYAVVLYRLDSDNNLALVREVVPQADGLRVVRAWGNAIFVVSPHVMVTTVSIVHTDDPERKDDVVFSQKGVFPYDGLTVAAAPPGSPVDLLIPWITDSTDPAHILGTVASVSSEPRQSGSRVRFNTWHEYADLRYEGGTGGPEVVTPPGGLAVGGALQMNLYGHPTSIDSLPAVLRVTNKKLLLVVTAASQKYFLLRTIDPSNQQTGDSEDIYVHDRTTDRWSTIQIEGSWSETRLFGPWLATLVRMTNLDKRPGPGRDSERGAGADGSPTDGERYEEIDGLPNVHHEYATWAGRFYWMPGILLIQNLADGRKIRIETDQEDSEILWVGTDTVLYRVNDTIYQAQIVGDKLQNTTVVVEDEGVPEIHWAFWSK